MNSYNIMVLFRTIGMYVGSTEIIFHIVIMFHCRGFFAELCTDDIINAQTLPDCVRENGYRCDYKCEKYYEKTGYGASVKCMPSGEWAVVTFAGELNYNLSRLCYRSGKKCSNTIITFGTMYSDCGLAIGDRCEYECEPGYTSSHVDHIVTCNGDTAMSEWSPSLSRLCYRGCVNDFPNGHVDPGCKREARSSCSFVCDQYFKERFVPNILNCTANGKWDENITTLCERIKCDPLQIENGQLDSECDLLANQYCSFHCELGFKEEENIPAVTCLGGETGNDWDHNGFVLCIRDVEDVNVIGIGIGVGVVGLIIIIVISVVICLKIRRRRSNRNRNESMTLRGE